MDWKLELVVIPVSDIDRAKAFYVDQVGFVADAEEAHAHLKSRGVEVSEVTPMAWGTFVFFADPDGNAWSIQQLPDWSKSAANS